MNPAADVHILYPVGDPEITTRVEDADVAGVQPAVLVDRLGRRLRVVEVAEHDVRATQQDFIALAEPYLEPGRGLARGLCDGLGVVVWPAPRRHHGFGEAVSGENRVEAQL